MCVCLRPADFRRSWGCCDMVAATAPVGFHKFGLVQERAMRTRLSSELRLAFIPAVRWGEDAAWHCWDPWHGMRPRRRVAIPWACSICCAGTAIASLAQSETPLAGQSSGRRSPASGWRSTWRILDRCFSAHLSLRDSAIQRLMQLCARGSFVHVYLRDGAQGTRAVGERC